MADDPRTDQNLIHAIREGDGSAFESLYLRHRDWAFRVAKRFTRDDNLAIDAVQEAFLYLHRKGRSLRLTARFTTFLYPVIRHEAQRLERMARRSGGAALDDTAGHQGAKSGPESAQTLKGESLDMLESALAPLPEPQREALLMHAVDGMTHGEIAIALGIPLGTVKSRIHAALATLRQDERLAEYFRE